MVAHLANLVNVRSRELQLGGDRLRVVLGEDSGAHVGDPLCGAASLYHHGGNSAGCRLPDYDSVRVVKRRENEQVAGGIVHAKFLAVVYRAGEYHLFSELQFVDVGFDFGAGGAVAYEHHAEVDVLFIEYFEAVENVTYPLVPQQASHEDEHRAVTFHAKLCAEFRRVFGVCSSAGEVNAVFHDSDTVVLVLLVAEVDKVLTRAFAYRPDLVSAGDVRDEHFYRLVLHELCRQGAAYVDIEFGVIGQHHRHAGLDPEDSRHQH